MKKLFLLMLFFTFCIKAQVAEDDPLEPIGPTPIRFYTGNLSGGWFTEYWGTTTNDFGTMTDSVATLMKRTSCSVICDYLPWCVIEQTPGVWDWSIYSENINKLNNAGLGYNVFAWLHFPPRWYESSDKFVPYVNIETGKSIPQLSLWSPDLPNIFENFYSKLNESLGNKIDFLRLAMPSEYGEIGYCAGMTKWLRPQENAEAGYWCGDSYAQNSFRQTMFATYGSLAEINNAWQTTFNSINEISMPDTINLPSSFSSSAAARQRWIDFIDWYHEAWVHCLTNVSKIVRKHFPEKEIIASLGYGSELPKFGNDQGRQIETMANLGLACQSPGDIGYFPTRRVSSACRHYKAPYFTEPPSAVPRDRELNRIFMDISNGVETWFDYLDNLDQARDYFRKYKKHLTGAAPKTTVAVWHPTLDHWLHPNQSWSEPSINLSEQLRDVLAYEIVDDRMIKTDALKTLKVRQLILVGATWLDSTAWQKVHEWVENGGVLIVLQSEPIADITGNTSLWEKQVPASIPETIDVNYIWENGTVKLGNGIVLTFNSNFISQEQLAELTGQLCESAGDKVGRTDWNAKQVDGKINNILTTIFDDKILYFNTTTNDQTLNLNFRESDFALSAARPEEMNMVLEIPARTIVEVPLTKINIYLTDNFNANGSGDINFDISGGRQSGFLSPLSYIIYSGQATVTNSGSFAGKCRLQSPTPIAVNENLVNSFNIELELDINTENLGAWTGICFGKDGPFWGPWMPTGMAIIFNDNGFYTFFDNTTAKAALPYPQIFPLKIKIYVTQSERGEDALVSIFLNNIPMILDTSINSTVFKHEGGFTNNYISIMSFSDDADATIDNLKISNVTNIAPEFSCWTGDTDSEITNSKYYTHAINFTTENNVNINGVIFDGVGAATTGTTWALTSPSNSFINVYLNEAGLENNLSGDSFLLGTGAVYSTDFSSTLILSDLNPDNLYELTLYGVGYDINNMVYLYNNTIEKISDYSMAEFGLGNGQKIKYKYKPDENGSFFISSSSVAGTGTNVWAWFAFSNEILDGIPEPTTFVFFIFICFAFLKRAN